MGNKECCGCKDDMVLTSRRNALEATKGLPRHGKAALRKTGNRRAGQVPKDFMRSRSQDNLSGREHAGSLVAPKPPVKLPDHPYEVVGPGTID